jgi:non-heme chloroperoxidase
MMRSIVATLSAVGLAAVLASKVSAAESPSGPPAETQAWRYHAVTSSDGLVLNVAEAGPRDAPPVLLLHGIGQSHVSWRRQLDGSLPQRLRLIAPDLRAHGDSGKPADPNAYRNVCRWADDVRAVITALQLERPVVVAWSFGGLVTMHYVRCTGVEPFAGFAFVASAGGRLVTSRPASVPGAAERTTAAGGARSVTTATQDMTGPDLRVNLRGARAFARLMTATPPDAEWEAETIAALMRLPAYARRAMAGPQLGPDGRQIESNADLAERLVDMPMLVIQGGRDALSDGAALAEAYRARFPRAQIVIYERSGHSPFAEEPERFAGDLERFVVEARGR